MKKNGKKLVVTVIHFEDDDHKVFNVAAGSRREARNLVEQLVREIKQYSFNEYAEETGYTFIKKWENPDTCNLYLGKHIFNFSINELH